MSLKAVHYINQFYAGIGGESEADTGFGILDKLAGPAVGLNAAWNGEMEIAKVIYCGDNYVNTEANWDEVSAKIKQVVEEVKPDVFIAGPAFNAGRYGVACAKVADYVRAELGVPSVTGMWWENPAVNMYVLNNYIISTTETAAGMRKSLPAVAALALKLAKGEKIGPARKEGYLPTGHRNNEYHEKSAAERTVDAVVNKLYNKPFFNEVPHRGYEQVKPAEPIKDMKNAKIALFSTGGLVPMGNPDKLKQAFSIEYKSYSLEGLTSLDTGKYESIHGGYDTSFANEDPHRLVPLDVIIDLQKEGYFKEYYQKFGATCGIGTNVVSGAKMGADWAQELKDAGVDACILTST